VKECYVNGTPAQGGVPAQPAGSVNTVRVVLG
jgi:hypothetical protein